MSEAFQYIDILILAIIAGIVLLRLEVSLEGELAMKKQIKLHITMKLLNNLQKKKL